MSSLMIGSKGPGLNIGSDPLVQDSSILRNLEAQVKTPDVDSRYTIGVLDILA